jgi:hypothetical protein
LQQKNRIIVKDRIDKEYKNTVYISKELKEIDLLSVNTKTGISINFPVSLTCQPTKVCAAVCYACKPQSFMMLNPAIIKANRNYQYFISYQTYELAAKLAKEFEKYQKKLGLKVLRWNGVGDLFPKSVEVINYMAKNYDITHLIYSRKPDQINNLIESDKIKCLMSLDESNYSRHNEITRKGTGFTFLRQGDFVPANIDIAVIFPVSQNYKNIPVDARDCPCDRKIIPLKLACVSCNLCIDRI